MPYEVRAIDFGKRLEDAEFLQASPTGAFPGIGDGDVRMRESYAILEYLAAQFGPTPLAPTCRDPAYPLTCPYLHFGEASLTGPLNIALATGIFAPDGYAAGFGRFLGIEDRMDPAVRDYHQRFQRAMRHAQPVNWSVRAAAQASGCWRSAPEVRRVQRGRRGQVGR